ncbi:conserved hypothetical protein [Hyella patelloides LEGE 07179]|uniref:Putative restriction endonuclease domain-containing protein n=1 Tax=Hyella patelloides LEGE 07179 TaxID=945734 RepID=A0A563W3L7_9CYAN|nr:Uma2 family endonuclease [Hyella patelloides]VEP18281.1 conserved hypothetical protein [Hyella patelloides LEGE 07179]
MTQTIPKLLTFEEFLHWKPEGRQYELYEGINVEIQPPGKHEEITGFLTTELAVEFKRIKLINLEKAIDRQSAYSPDVLILNRPALKNETLWEKYSTVQTAESIPLIIEVVSTNWRDDYLTKLRDYEEIGVKEY